MERWHLYLIARKTICKTNLFTLFPPKYIFGGPYADHWALHVVTEGPQQMYVKRLITEYLEHSSNL